LSIVFEALSWRSMMSCTLADRRVLLVEDDYVVAQQMAHELGEVGAQIVGPVPTPDAALELAREQQLDAAVLDIHLRGGTVYPVADLLVSKGVPFLFATGYDRRTIPENYAEIRVYEKAAQASTLAEALSLELGPKRQSIGTELRYTVRQNGDLWLWEIRRFGIVMEAGVASSSVNARMAVFLWAMRRSH
jgi:CheY-like chemotaxis protein